MSIRNAARGLVAAGGAAVLVLISAGTASAHAVLLGTSPAAGSTTARAPVRVTLSFSEVIEAPGTPLVVTGPTGRPLALTGVGRDPADATVLVARLPAHLPTGTYGVSWRITSLDGHAVHGLYRFALGAPDGPLTGPGQSSQAGPTALGGVGRAFAAAGVLALLGLAAFEALVLNPVRRRLDVRERQRLPDVAAALRRRMVAALVLALGGTCAVLVDSTSGSTGRPAAALLGRPDLLLSQASATRAGALLAVRLVTLVGLAVLLLWRPVTRSRRQALVAVACVAALPTFSLASHAVAVRADRPVAVLLDGLHLAASGIWAGGLLALATVGPAVAGNRHAGQALAADVIGRLTARFSAVAQLCMLLVVVTGTYAVLIRVGSLSDLAATSWGVALTVKLALWVTLLLLAGANVLTLLPRVSRRVERASRRAVAAGELASSVRVELALGGALLAVAAVLAATSPPAEARLLETNSPVTTTTAPASYTGAAQEYALEVGVRRSTTGPVTGVVLSVTLSRQGTPIAAGAADVLLAAPNRVPRRVRVHELAEGTWESDPLALAGGSYQLTGTFSRSEGAVVVPVPITVAG